MSVSAPVEQQLELVVERKEAVAEGVVALTLRSAVGGVLPAWAPGAHVDLVLGPDLTRQYSLCGDPAVRDTYRVAVLREPAGRGGSAYVHDKLADGDQVRAVGPRNHFALGEAQQYLFIAGGIGITPLLPMIAAVDAAGKPWRLVYGGRTRASMAFREELATTYPDRVRIEPMDEVGLLDLDGILVDPAQASQQTAVYCCGPEPLLGAVEAKCAGWPRGALHVERFAPKAGATDGPRDEFEVELTLSNLTISVAPDTSILEAVDAAGIQVLSSCQEGTCGTCETTVLDGVPDHRDSVLTDEEQAANDTMMICVSRARSARLVLEI